MNTLHQKTKELIDLIKQVKPKIKIDEPCEYCENIYGQMIPVYNIAIDGLLHPEDKQEQIHPTGIPVLTADTLLHLIPQLFEGVENSRQIPDSITLIDDAGCKHVLWKANGTERLWYVSDTYDDEIMAACNSIEESARFMLDVVFPRHNIVKREYARTETVSYLLLYKYFVDGLWLQSQEAVLQDIIDNIKNTYDQK